MSFLAPSLVRSLGLVGTRHGLNHSWRCLSTSPAMAEYRVSFEKSKVSRVEAQGKTMDESEDTAMNLDVLASLEDNQTDFKVFPDQETLEETFDGVKYSELPHVTVRMSKNNTRFYAVDHKGEEIAYVTPSQCGFINAQKKTNVAAQVAGMTMGQRLRNRNIKTIRVRVDGFNNGRVASLKGLQQAGIRVVSITDCTVVDWGWSQRAKKKPRKN